MAQWQELQKLDPSMQSRVCRLYEGKFPREIRHYLSDWIESQNWDVAASDEPTARTVLQALVLKLDELRNDSIHNNNVLMGPDYSAMRDFMLNHFESRPLALAGLLSDCLKEEKAILTSCLKDQPCSAEEQKQRDLDNKVRDLNKRTWETEREIKSLEALNEKLEYIQGMWESQAERENGLSREFVQQECLNQAHFITQTKQVVVDQIVKSVNLAVQIVTALTSAELPEWKRRQRMSCIGNPVSTSLDHLEKWFTTVAEMLLQIHQQLKKLQEQSSRHQISDVSEVIQQIDTFTKSLLIKLMENALVVEKQPAMLNLTHRPCILKTRVRFTVTLRFLVNLPMFKCLLKVKPVFDKDVEEVNTIKGFRQFVFIANDSKVLDVYKPEGGLVAEFGHMSIKEAKEGSKSRIKGSNESPFGVTEELHIIKFVTKLQLAGLECQIEASSLPVVVVSSTSQAPSAWATVLWYNLLSSTEPRSLSVFVEPPPLSWEQLSQALSWQFISAGDRELNEDQLSELKLKIVDDPDDLVYWNKFAKNDGPWIWIDGILELIQKHLRDIWRDGCIMGFVNKDKTRQLLQNKQSGNFLLRFSESNREGAITFSWVEHSNGEVNVYGVEPYTRKELSAMSLTDIIFHYGLRAQQRKTTNPLVYLYPDIPKDNVFGQYYTTPAGISAPINKDGYVNRKIISVSDCPSPPPSLPRETQMDVETDFLQSPQSVLSEEFLQELFPGLLDPSRPPTSFIPNEQMFPQLTNYDNSYNIGS